MVWKCNFSFKHYFEVLDYAKRKYSIGPIEKFQKLKKRERFMLLRHDVDFSLDYALKMAKAEAEHGLHATYFVLLHSPYYNALSEPNVSIIRNISELGHEIGLHYDPLFLPVSSTKAFTRIEEETRLLANITGKKITSIAPHNGTDLPKMKTNRLLGFLNGRGSQISKTAFYISDSVQNWRLGCMCNHIDKEKRLQILTHPIWWGEHHKPRDIILDEFKNNVVTNLASRLEFLRCAYGTYLRTNITK